MTQSMSKSATLGASVLGTLKSMVRSPVAFARQPAFLAVYGVYAATCVYARDAHMHIPWRPRARPRARVDALDLILT